MGIRNYDLHATLTSTISIESAKRKMKDENTNRSKNMKANLNELAVILLNKDKVLRRLKSFKSSDLKISKIN